jgi:hypothetical protein
VKLFQRYYYLSIVVLSISVPCYGMVMDNRCFPWFPHLYSVSDALHASVTAEPFFITSSSAMKISVEDVRSREYGYPNLKGMLDYYEVGKAFEIAGLENPIPADWRFAAPFPVGMPGSFEGQGINFAGYVPFHEHCAIGSSFFLMRLHAQTNLVPGATKTENLSDKLNLAAAGNKARFAQLSEDFENTLGIQDGYWSTFGVSDLEVYVRLFNVQEYVYWCKLIETMVTIGLFVPTGLQTDAKYIASIPFGGDGFWGWYFAPSWEVELKDDWVFGFEWRIEKRFPQVQEIRICVAQESSLFAPVTGPVKINPGLTFGIMPYFALENIREGLGVVFQYSYVTHKKDRFTDKREEQVPVANFQNMKKNSAWTQEYGTIELLYDLSFKQDWTYKPICTFAWDIPLNAMGSKGACKTHRISLGLTVDF